MMEEVRIREFGEIYTGKTPPTENPQNFGFTFPFVTPVDLTDYKYIKETERYVSVIGIKHTTLIPVNSICVSCIGYIGKIGITTKESCTNQQINSIVVNNNYNPDYVYYLLSYSVPYFKELAGVNVVAQLNKRDFSKVKLQATKHKPEQTAIATILSKVDEAIAATQNSIKAAEKLKKALMQNLLTGKLKPDGSWRTEEEFYTDEKFGKVPKGWEVKKLKDISKEIIMGQSPSSESYNDLKRGLPYVQGNADFKNKEINIRTYTNDPKKISYINDILITVRAPVGDIYKNTLKKIAIGRGITAISIQNQSLNVFVSYILQWDKKQFLRLEQGTTFTEIGKREVRNLLIKVPSENEREKITIQIDSIRNKINDKQTKIQTLERLKKSLMQNLLTGKKRLPQSFIQQFENNGEL